MSEWVNGLLYVQILTVRVWFNLFSKDLSRDLHIGRPFNFFIGAYLVMIIALLEPTVFGSFVKQIDDYECYLIM